MMPTSTNINEIGMVVWVNKSKEKVPAQQEKVKTTMEAIPLM